MLLSVKYGDVYYNILFLHTDSGRRRKDYHNRQTMFEKIGSLKYTLDGLQSAAARLIVMGDLNTMGRDCFGDLAEVTGPVETANLDRDMVINRMHLLQKTHAATNL